MNKIKHAIHIILRSGHMTARNREVYFDHFSSKNLSLFVPCVIVLILHTCESVVIYTCI